ncbi:MAG TPA: M1 family aminopeptidase [Myxococcales bacterium]|nr:M1 family aminopeptidase [Myxococcales bacterium]
MGLGKNFRLSPDVRPLRYGVRLVPDLSAGTFEGRMELTLQLSAPRRDLQLHAVGLQISAARALPGPSATASADPESETVTLRFDGELPAGKVVLDLAWKGAFSGGLRGLYRAGPLAVTQFEAADARRVFPCFDEPAFKARWSLELAGLPDGVVALSNAPVVQDDKAPAGRTVRFAETPPLSSYLVALCIGELASSPEQKIRAYAVRTWAVPQKQALTAFGQQVACAVLPLLEDYFGQPYAYGKVDQVGVPDFEAGAMENAGCITYREVALLLDPAAAPLNVQKRVAEVITHELSHQWFGNLVTMTWWDDLWLNEAFATWMAYKIVDQWRPEWRVWMDFEGGKGAALHLDALKSSHPIRAEIRNAEEAGEAFDAITYEKGGAILRMIEGYLGPERFRAGIRLYMRRHREANATADDLWRALGEAGAAGDSGGEPILELANGWIRQTGYPLVTISQRDGKLHVSQKRFFSDPGAAPEPTGWLVPLVLRYGGREERVLLRGREQVVDPGGPMEWVLGNVGARGFYRTAYDPDLLRKLIRALPELRPEERMALVSDQWALVRAAAVQLDGFLQLLAGLHAERDHTVLDEVVGRLGYLEHRAVGEPDRPALQAWVRSLFAPAAAELGWEPGPGEEDERRLRRAAVLRALTLVARDQAAIDEAAARYRMHVTRKGQPLDPNLLDIVVPAAARSADANRFEELRGLARTELDPAAKRRYLHALALVEHPDLVDRAVALALDPFVQMQDFASYLGALLSNRATRDAAWALIQSRWEEVRRKGDSPMILRRLVEALGSLPERRHLEEVESFLAAHELSAARQAVAQTLERLRADVALRERLLPEIGAFLRAGGARS